MVLICEIWFRDIGVGIRTAPRPPAVLDSQLIWKKCRNL